MRFHGLPAAAAAAPPPPQINTSNLERVRRIKNRMVRLTTRVETVRHTRGGAVLQQKQWQQRQQQQQCQQRQQKQCQQRRH